MWQWIYRLSSPRYFFALAARINRWLVPLTFLVLAYGIYAGLVLAPADYKQGDGFRIMYFHVPAAFSSLMIYSVMAVAAFIFLIWKIKLADMIVAVSAPIGAAMTALALFTGAVWGKPMWGTWWVWDARLTSELILFFIYLAVIGLRNALRDQSKCSDIVAFFTLFGFVDIPIIHFSVVWWNTLHQGASISLISHSSIAFDMLLPLLIMLAGFLLFYVSWLFAMLRLEILQRELATEWVQRWFEVKNNEH